MAEVIDLHPEAEKRGLSPALWAEALWGYKGIEFICSGGPQGYKIEAHPEGCQYSIMFCEDGYPDGTFEEFFFYYEVDLREAPSLEEINAFNQTSFACCVLDDNSMRFSHRVHLGDAQVTESILKHQIDRWMLALPGIAAFAHRYGD